jgi:exonuclease VII large subunit
MELTKKHFDQQISRILKNATSKSDLKHLATKSELKQFSTSLDIKLERLVDTVDKLSHAVAKGFQDVDERFDKLNDRLAGMALQSHMLTLERRIEKVEAQLTATNHSK